MKFSNHYYLYVYSIDMCGRHDLICGKLFFDKDKAINESKKYTDIPGYHVQIEQMDKIIYSR